MSLRQSSTISFSSSGDFKEEVESVDQCIKDGNRFEICSSLTKLSNLVANHASTQVSGGSLEMDQTFAKAANHFKEGEFCDGWSMIKHLIVPQTIETHGMYLGAKLDDVISLITSYATKTVQFNITPKSGGTRSPLNIWVEATSAARIDLAGGWTDTPPICNDFGGAVAGVGIVINGKRPIGCRIRRVEHMGIQLHRRAQNKKGFTKTYLKIQDLEDFSDPTSDFALVKSCLHLATDFSLSQGTLDDLLVKHFGVGIEIETWSDLPEGTGLGTSSILAGTILACLWDCMGLIFSIDDIIHGVLQVEQLLTTGGGWQDQVNGLLPGIKIGRCLPREPLTVTHEVFPLEHPFNKVLESHLVLVYTGKVRLAKNLLQNVVKAWYSKKDVIHQAIQANHDLANRMWTAIHHESVEQMGECLNAYWAIKKILAEGSEPESILPILEATKPLSFGQSLGGAGGGGFLVVVTKAPNALEQIQSAVEHLGVTCHRVGIDLEGLTVIKEQSEERKTFY